MIVGYRYSLAFIFLFSLLSSPFAFLGVDWIMDVEGLGFGLVG